MKEVIIATIYIFIAVLQSCVLYIGQVKQRSRDAILALELLTKLNEGVDVRNMMEGNFNFSQFQVHVHIMTR